MYAITRAKIIDEAEAEENHIEFARWQLFEWKVSDADGLALCELDVEVDELRARAA